MNFKITKLILITALFFSLIGCAGNKPDVTYENLIFGAVDSLFKEEAMRYYLDATIHEEAGELYQAAIKYQLARTFDPNSSSLIISLTNIYNRLGEAHAALIVLESAWYNNKTDNEIAEALIKHYVVNQMFHKAVIVLETIRDERALSLIETKNLGSLLVKMNRLDEALGIFSECEQQYGFDASIGHKVAEIHLMKNDMDSARNSLRRILEVDSTNHFVYFILGNFDLEEKDWQHAFDNFEEAVNLDTEDVRYWSSLLLSLRSMEKMEELFLWSKRAVQNFPNIAQFHDIQGDALVKLDRAEEALVSFISAIKLDSSRISPYISIGYIHHQDENWALSSEAYQEALKIDNDHPLVLNNFAYMLSNWNKDLDRALLMVNRALELDPENASYLDTKGWVLFKMNSYEEALEEIKRAWTIEKDNPEILEHMGHIYKALGSEEEAKQSWKQAYELDPTNETYKKLLR